MISREELKQNMLVGIHEKSTRFSPNVCNKTKGDRFADVDVTESTKIYEGV